MEMCLRAFPIADTEADGLEQRLEMHCKIVGWQDWKTERLPPAATLISHYIYGHNKINTTANNYKCKPLSQLSHTKPSRVESTQDELR